MNPGIITTVQLVGDRLNHHVHLHIVCTDGAFDDGRFFHLPMGPEDLKALEHLFSEEIFAELIRLEKITPAGREDMRSWRHSGFSANAAVRVGRGDLEALTRLLRYVAQPPIANERVAYEPSTGESTMHKIPDWRRKMTLTCPSLTSSTSQTKSTRSE